MSRTVATSVADASCGAVVFPTTVDGASAARRSSNTSVVVARSAILQVEPRTCHLDDLVNDTHELECAVVRVLQILRGDLNTMNGGGDDSAIHQRSSAADRNATTDETASRSRSSASVQHMSPRRTTRRSWTSERRCDRQTRLTCARRRESSAPYSRLPPSLAHRLRNVVGAGASNAPRPVHLTLVRRLLEIDDHGRVELWQSLACFVDGDRRTSVAGFAAAGAGVDTCAGAGAGVAGGGGAGCLSLQPSTATTTRAAALFTRLGLASGRVAEPVVAGGGVLAEPVLLGVALPAPVPLDGVALPAPLPVSPEPVGGGVTTFGCTTSFALMLPVMRDAPSVHAFASRY